MNDTNLKGLTPGRGMPEEGSSGLSVRVMKLFAAVAVVVAILAVAGMTRSPDGADAATNFYLPWKSGVAHRVNQTWNAGAHKGINIYGYDFNLAKNEAVLASAPRDGNQGGVWQQEWRVRWRPQ